MKNKSCLALLVLGLLFTSIFAEATEPVFSNKIITNDGEYAGLEITKRRRPNGRVFNRFRSGFSLISAGYGYPNFYEYDAYRVYLKAISEAKFSESYNVKIAALGPFHVNYEYALSDKLAIGAQLSYSSMSLEAKRSTFYDNGTNQYTPITYKETFKVFQISALAKVNYHFLTGADLDPYLSAGIGANFMSDRYDNHTTEDENDVDRADKFKYPSIFAFEVAAGLRYFFIEQLGVFVEGGFATNFPIARGGVSFKF